jgi:hypothetical protein
MSAEKKPPTQRAQETAMPDNEPSAEALTLAKQAREYALNDWNGDDNPRRDLDDYLDDRAAREIDAAYRRGFEAGKKLVLVRKERPGFIVE